ncbi:hypothetical protein AMATHDRAFT_3793 [Amanita thiersii Skay4041]|uniref:Transmembrane protein n=1 Tax=Amanita thiersii Skay4041 TaxID=703135 RepID=A0A2A9NSE0_9AGAR|nr:hypothetical protein AMATHDRAFT_3793 [Amanita thiersii Skay4041]
MPDWQSPQEIQKEAVIFTKFMHSLLGLYIYEWFLSLDFDWAFITGKKAFRWPMIFYFANRYLLLFALIGIAIALDTTEEINCQALFTFNQIAGDAAVGLASINLSIRTMAVWSQNRIIVGVLALVILGHWSLILQGVQLTAMWVPGVGCAITDTNNKILAAIFIYSMCFDLLVLLLNTYKLFGINSKAGQAMGTSRIGKMIFEDGLIYFVIAFLANLIATIFMLMNLNSIMSVIFNVPAAIGSTIVACRAVRRLSNFTNQGPEVYASHSSGTAFRGNATRGLPTIGNVSHGAQTGVHVQMETFTRAEQGNDADYKYDQKVKGQLTSERVLRGDASTEMDIDLEAKAAL